jgi:hypothetical protein
VAGRKLGRALGRSKSSLAIIKVFSRITGMATGGPEGGSSSRGSLQTFVSQPDSLVPAWIIGLDRGETVCPILLGVGIRSWLGV